MLSLAIARQLRDAGLSWTPQRGDRFVVADRDMDGDRGADAARGPLLGKERVADGMLWGTADTRHDVGRREGSERRGERLEARGEPSIRGRPNHRTSAPNEYWRRPLASPPIVDSRTIDEGVTPNSSMMAR